MMNPNKEAGEGVEKGGGGGGITRAFLGVADVSCCISHYRVVREELEVL